MRRIGKRFKIIFLLVCTLFLCLFCGASTMNAELLNSGKGDIGLTVNKAALAEYEVSDLSSFKTFFDKYLSDLNFASGDNDFLEAKEYADGGEYYTVTVKTRRIDKIKGLGTIDYATGEDFYNDPQSISKLQKWSAGDISEKALNRRYPNGSVVGNNISISKGNKLAINAIDVATQETKTYEDFSGYLVGTDDRIVMLRLVDLSFVESITLSVNGRIRYISSECVKLVDNNTVEITSVNVRTEGVNTADVMFGFFTYTQYLSPAAIAVICVLALAVIVFVVLGIVNKWFVRFFKGKTWRNILKSKALYVMILPGLALLVIFHYMPMAWLATAFQEYNLQEGLGSEWVGMKYFRKILYAENAAHMYRVFRNTIFISLIRIGSNFPLILAFALLVHSLKNRHVKTVFQAISFIPYFLSWSAVGGMAYALLGEYGLINQILVKMGSEAVSWYTATDKWWTILAISSLWKGMGWGTLIYIAAMCNIDSELYEACALDGGGALRQAFTVTLPSIMNMICLQLILDTGAIMKDNYEQILAMINGVSKVDETVEVIGAITFKAVKNSDGFGSATAMGLIQGTIGLILVFFTNKVVKKSDNEGIL